jgi:hypothetical protein
VGQKGPCVYNLQVHASTIKYFNESLLCIFLFLLQEAKLGHAASREEIADALREVMRRVLSGEPAVDIFLGNDRNSQSVATVLTRHNDDMSLQDASVPQAKTTSIL